VEGLEEGGRRGRTRLCGVEDFEAVGSGGALGVGVMWCGRYVVGGGRELDICIPTMVVEFVGPHKPAHYVFLRRKQRFLVVAIEPQ
jgi:hypothetical protein